MEKLSKLTWWKWLTMGILVYVIIGAFLFDVPRLPILNEGIRNLHFHVPMWFAEVTLMAISLYHSVVLLRQLDPELERVGNPLIIDAKAREAAAIGLVFNLLGLITGILWSRVSWAEDQAA